MKARVLFTSMIVLVALSLLSCKKNLKDIIQECKRATFTIYTFDEYGSPSGSGSGFFIDETGMAISNYHVLDGATKAIIRTIDSLEYEIDKVVASDKKWDIVKFSVKNNSNKNFSYLKFADRPVEQGDKVCNISSPMGLEQTVSEGIVSSVRNDSHGDLIQITAPISSGSSGSAILNEQGEVIAVATYKKRGGENLNFGVSVSEERLMSLNKNEFGKKHPEFNKKENFIILNLQDEGVTLHALEFKSDATIAYLSYTNLTMAYEHSLIWCELNQGDDSFTIIDKDRNKKYHVISSTIGTTKANGTEVPLASNYRFKVFFPAIKDTLVNININTGTTSRDWKFNDINLDKYKNQITFDSKKYMKEYAYSVMSSGDMSEAISTFNTILEENPEDADALNAMGIISYVVDNNMDAQYYFSEVIETHPNSTTGLLNRSYLYKYQKEYAKALDDITKAININSAQPDNYYMRALLYIELEKYKEAIWDLSKALESVDYKEEPLAYSYRAICYSRINKIREAREDIQTAYNYATDPEMERMLEGAWAELHQ